MLITIPEDRAARDLHQPLAHTVSAPPRTDYTRLLKLYRPPSGSYGFHLRGGKEYNTGFFISHVEPGSEAFAQGLRSGDQVLRLNNMNVLHSLHKEIATMVKNSSEILLEVKSSGLIPVKNNPEDQLSWVSVQDSKHQRNSSLDSQPVSLKSNSSSSSSSSFTFNPIHIVMKGAGKGSIGCSICKGPQDKPGIFVQKIIEGGVAEEAGLRPGDQILSCNGISFLRIEFQQAVHHMKSHTLKMEVLRGAGMDFVAGESSGYNSSVSSEGDDSYPQSEESGRETFHKPAKKLPSKVNSLHLDFTRDWKEIEDEWAQAEVREKRKLFTSYKKQASLPHSQSLLNLSTLVDKKDHKKLSLKNPGPSYTHGHRPNSSLSKPQSMSDIRQSLEEGYKISLHTSTSAAHVNKIVVPPAPKNEQNAIKRLEQLSATSTKNTCVQGEVSMVQVEPVIGTCANCAATYEILRKNEDRPDTAKAIEPIKPPSIESLRLFKASRYNGRNHKHVWETEEDSDCSYPLSKISISSENGKYTSKVIIRSSPPEPPPRAFNTKLSRHHKRLSSQSSYNRDKFRQKSLPEPSHFYICTHSQKSSLSISSDESGAWEDMSDSSPSSLSSNARHSTLPRDHKSSIPPPPPPPLAKTESLPLSVIPPPPPLPTPNTAMKLPLSLGAALTEEILSRKEQETNGLRSVQNSKVEKIRKPIQEDPKKQQHEQLMEEFKKKHALMFSKKKNQETEEQESEDTAM